MAITSSPSNRRLAGGYHQVVIDQSRMLPEHHQVAAELEAGLLYQVGLPVAPEDLQEHRGLWKIDIGLEQGFGDKTYNTYIRRILGDQFGQDDSTIHLQEKRLLLFFIFFGEHVVCVIRRCFLCLGSLD